MTIKGFDYRTGQEVVRDTRQWKTEAAQILSSGGFRRVENGETFIHGSNGRIVLEAYGYIPKAAKP